MKRILIFTLLFILLFVLLTGCDNGSVSESVTEKSSSLVKVCLTVGDSSGAQKSAAIDGSYWTSLTYQYNAVPQWTDPQGTPIHGATSWIPINYSAGMSLGYFTPGQWVFGIRIKNGSTVVYEGFSDVINVKNTSVAVDVLVNKLVTDAVAGSVRISVTAPSALNDTLTISYENEAGTASDSEIITATSASDRYPFEHTFTGLTAGNYTFTFTHSAGNIEDTLDITIPADSIAVISGHLNNRIWQLDYSTARVHSIGATWTGAGNVQTNAASAAVGDPVSFYVKPASGAALNSVTVSWSGGSITPSSNINLYSFIMPDGDVSINATFDSVDTDINMEHFKTIFMAFYDSNPGVKAFGRSGTAPRGVEYLGIKDVMIWYDGDQIYWFADNINNTIKFSTASMAEFFKGLNKFESISLQGFDTSNITDMHGLFENCTGLTSLDLSGLDASSVTDISDIFHGCTSLATLDFSGADISSVTDMSDMFRDCTSLVRLYLDGFAVNNTNNVEVNMQGLFRGCVNLRGNDNNILDLSSFNTSRVTDMSYMFCGCKALTEIEFGDHFDTSLVTDMSYMFSSVDSGTAGNKDNKMNLTSLDVSGFDTQNVTNMSHMFYMCSNESLTTLAVSHFDTSKVTDMSYMFGCWEGAPSYVTSFNLSGWDFSKVTTVNRMFDRCQYATTITFPERTKWSRIEDMLYMFSNCYRLTRAQLKIIIAEWDFSEHNNTTALSTLFSNVTDGDSNPEASPSNRLFKNNMCYSKHKVVGGADFDTRDEYPTYNINSNPIKKLYVGGDITSHVMYQRLTTVETP